MTIYKSEFPCLLLKLLYVYFYCLVFLYTFPFSLQKYICTFLCINSFYSNPIEEALYV